MYFLLDREATGFPIVLVGGEQVTCSHYSARCFRAFCTEIPRSARAKLHEMQFLCIA